MWQFYTEALLQGKQVTGNESERRRRESEKRPPTLQVHDSLMDAASNSPFPDLFERLQSKVVTDCCGLFIHKLSLVSSLLYRPLVGTDVSTGCL